MSVSIQQLMVAYENKALSIDYKNGNGTTALLGGVQINLEQAHRLCQANFGWSEYVLSPFEIIDKTHKFMRALKSHLTNEMIWERGTIEFINKKDVDYGRTFDRICIQTEYFSTTIIYNMKSAGCSYVVYRNGQANPVAKCRTLKQVIENINELSWR